MKLYFDVKNQVITRTDRNQVIANSADYLEAEITFSDEWSSLEKTMTFKNGNLLYTYVLENNKILADNHLNLGVGTWKVSIQGVSGDQKIITNECNLAVNASGWIGSEAIPPESIWNQLLVIIESLHTEVASTAALRSAVQKYIEDNYDALVKEEVIVDDVRAALDDMAEDGTLSDLLAPLVAAGMPSVVADQISAVVAAQIGATVASQIGAVVASQITAPVNQAVKDYCDDNFSGWSGALDRGLTQPLMAAPADMVGAIKSALTIYDRNFFEEVEAEWDRKTIGNGTGSTQIGTTGKAYEGSTTRICFYPPTNIRNIITINVSVESGYKYFIYAFDKELTTATTITEWETDSASYNVAKYEYAAVVLAKTDNSTIDVSDASNITIECSVFPNVTKSDLTEINEDIDKAESDIKSLKDFDNIAKLNQYIKEGSIIPFDQYELLLCIQANASNMDGCKINTGLAFGPGLRTELDAEFTDISGSNFMGREADGGRAIRNAIGIYSGDLTKFYFGFGDENLYGGTSDTKRHVFFIDVPNLTYGYDNNVFTKSAFTYGNYTDKNIFLFGTIAMGTIAQKSKVYGARFYNNGELIAYFVPVLRLSDNKVGFYDVIRKSFYTNEDATSLLVGLSFPNSKAENLPKYWENYFSTNLSEYRTADAALGRDGVSFAFITDVHVDTNNMMSPKLLEWIAKNTNVKSVVFGGDLITNYNTKANAMTELYKWTGETGALRIVNLHGNHDGNSNNQTDMTQVITDNEFYGLECRQSENIVSYVSGKLYGYSDNENQKVRFIYLDTGAPDSAVINATQIAWLKARIQELDSGWFVVVFCHQFWTGRYKTYDTLEIDANGTAIMGALDEIYDDVNATIACVISGHCHRDYSMVSTKGYPIIATTCDASGTNASNYDPDTPNRIAGTTSEQCFDLYYVNTSARTINTVRIGAGGSTRNRSFVF